MNHRAATRLAAVLLLVLAGPGLLRPARAASPPEAPSAAGPSVESMVEALRMKPLTRSLGARPGAAAARREGRLQLSVSFDFASARLTPASRDLLAKLAAAMGSPELAGLEYRIEGHTDATGSGASNLRLSQRRAEAVRDFLAQASGVAPARLAALGMGSAKLLDREHPAAGVNRRVVVVSLEPLPAAAGVPQAPAKGPASAPQAARPGAGTVEQVRGEVHVRRGPSSAVVSQGTRVREGDVLTSGRGATALVRLDDGAKLLLRAESVLHVVKLRLAGDALSWSQAFELVVGAFRYVTGALGGNRPEAVAISTAFASVGIRGTDIDVVQANEGTGDAEAGTYVKVNRGAVSIGAVDGTRLDLGQDEQGYAGARKPRTRGGKPVPAAVRLQAPAPVFRTGEFDGLLEER